MQKEELIFLLLLLFLFNSKSGLLLNIVQLAHGKSSAEKNIKATAGKRNVEHQAVFRN